MKPERQVLTRESESITIISAASIIVISISHKSTFSNQVKVLIQFNGNARFEYYLGVEPTGFFSAVKLDNGTKAFEEMKKEPYLYVVSFSDFSMDSLSGYFGGEIRLAYIFDGEKVTPVTGGSVSGNLLELQKDMAFSTERYKDKNYDGPFAVEFHGVAVAGK